MDVASNQNKISNGDSRSQAPFTEYVAAVRSRVHVSYLPIDYKHLYPKVGKVKELSFSPKLGIEPLSIEHVTSMSIKYPRPDSDDVPDSTLALIGEYAKNLKNLTIIMIYWPQDTIRMGLTPMFRGLKDSLKVS